VNKEEAINLLDDMKLMILDVRSPEEVEENDLLVEDAINIEMNDDFLNRIEMLPKDRSYLVYSENGVRSLRAANLMNKNGFATIYNLKDGLNLFIEETASCEDRN
jgi:rhodanese-related sulfurtransferase